MTRHPRLMIAASVAVAVVGVGAPAQAGAVRGDDGNVTGGDVTDSGDDVPLEVRRQSDAKQIVADAYIAAKYGAGDAASFAAAARAYQRAYPGGADEKIATTTNADDAAQMIATATYAVNKLGVIHYAQIHNYFCGPATGKMIVRYRGDGVSAYNGASQTQEHLGGSAHMQTEINGKTGWASGLFRIGLNRWREGTSTGYYVDKDTPTAAEFESDLVYDADHGYPVAADTVEFAGGVHYNGHPKSETIGHWLIAKGYYSYGDGTYFADPSTSVWSAANEEFSYATATFANRFLQNNGITW